MDTTLKVAAHYNCDVVSFYENMIHPYDPLWRQTVAGCKILELLQDMYGFNISYIIEPLNTNKTTVYGNQWTSTIQNFSFDLFLRPMSLRLEHLDSMIPIHKAYDCRMGFILKNENRDCYQDFYGKPFTEPVWKCLVGMAIFLSFFFYFLKKYEFRNIGGFECSYPYELLMVIGGYCQHIPPIEATLPSRRIAYLTFFLFAYTIYTYYTSNLLSHLVNDKEIAMSLHSLSGTHLQFVVSDYLMLTMAEHIPVTTRNFTSIMNIIRKFRPVSVQEGLNGVKAGKYALLSDYTSVYPTMIKTFTADELCDISKLDIFPHVPKYFFVSKQLPYIEEFKIGLLRARESGILKRLLEPYAKVPKCVVSPLVQAKLVQISGLIIKLLATYVISVLILILERVIYDYKQRRLGVRLWPYIE